MLWQTLIHIAHLLADDRCWFYDGAFHLPLDAQGSATLAVSPDSAGRIRIDTCAEGVRRATKWARTDDHARLATIVREARDENQATLVV
jgi:hypothetical protein